MFIKLKSVGWFSDVPVGHFGYRCLNILAIIAVIFSVIAGQVSPISKNSEAAGGMEEKAG